MGEPKKRCISVTMPEEQQRLLRSLTGKKLEEIRTDALVNGVALAELVTESAVVCVKNLQYEAPLQEDSRDYPVLFAERAEKPMEGLEAKPVGEMVKAVFLVREHLRWTYHDMPWDITCDTSIRLMLETRSLAITVVDSETGMVRLKCLSSDTEEKGASWKEKCSAPSLHTVELRRL